MRFDNLAYAKVNLSYDADTFAEEYDKRILPFGISICNSASTMKDSAPINKFWGMVPPDEYDKADVWTQEGNATSINYITRQRPQWKMVQLMELDVTNITDPLFLRYSKQGGPSIRNETLDPKYKFKIKPHFADLKIYKWIQENLPFEEIKSLHCVSIEAGGLSTIHRDSKGFFTKSSSAGFNRVYKNGYVIVCLNISNGGGPLWWCLDGPGVLTPYQSDDQVYISNDYFLHAVPLMSSRRRQIRIMGRPKPELWDLLEKNGMITIPDDYKYEDNFPVGYLPPNDSK
jgi:hypothetical protein